MGKNGGGSSPFGTDQLCAWDVNDLQYTGPCTRNLLVEKPGVDFSLSPRPRGLEGIEKVNELARKRPQLRQRVADSTKNKRYTYAPYGIAFSTKTNHENHLKTQNHREKASGTTKTPPRRYRRAYLRRPPTSRRRDIAVLFATMLLEHRNYLIIISTRSSITRGSS
jgi:hypothetical protein